jgi:signal transduction histidine kinase/CHASE3 domain sensor protein
LKSIAIRLKEKVQRKLSRVWQRREIGKVGSVLLAIPAACLALVLLGVTDVRQKEQQIELDIRSIERRVKLSEQVLRYVIDQETGVRGYLLTQDRQFLDPYHAAKKDLFPELTALKQQSSDQKEILQQLEEQIMLRLLQAEGLLEFAEAIDLPPNTPLFSSPKGVLSQPKSAELLQQLKEARQTTDAIRQTIETFKQQQQQILALKNDQLKRSKQFVDQVQMLGALLSVLSYVGVVGLFQLLDRRMTQRDREIQQTQDTIQTLTNHLVDGVIMVDKRGRIENINPAAERILDRSSQDLTGKSLMNVLFPPELMTLGENASEPDFIANSTAHSDAAAWVQSKAETGIVVQLQAQQSNGQMIPIELSVSRSTSTWSNLIVLIRDVSERVQLTQALSDKVIELDELNQQLLRINILLQHKNQSLETFVKAAAHDLKTPIRGIASLAQWLEADLSESLTPESQTSLRLLNQRVLRMQAIADGLLSYASIEAWIDQQATVDTRALVEEICRQIPVPESFSVRILGEMPTLRTPYLALKLVFEQLICNAIDHHDRGRGIIEIIATPQKHWTQFVVRDDGPGIAPAYRDRVLQMFQVLDQKPDVSENIGVGLALVYRAVQLAGGTLDLQSPSTNDSRGRTIDRGLEVSFTWPFLEQTVTG